MQHAEPHPGTIIILNGASSSGKSSILSHLQRTLPGPFLNAGIDKFIFMLPSSYLNRPLWDDVLGKADHAGEQGHILFSGMHHALPPSLSSSLRVQSRLPSASWPSECSTGCPPKCPCCVLACQQSQTRQHHSVRRCHV